MTRFCCWVNQPARQTTRRLNLGKFTARFALFVSGVQAEIRYPSARFRLGLATGSCSAEFWNSKGVAGH